MKLIKIKGSLANITIFTEIYDNPTFIKEIEEKNLEKFNIQLIQNRTFYHNGLIRTYADRKIRVKAYATIEIEKGDWQQYVIYLDKKGYYCNVLGKKTYLNNILESED